MSLELSNKYPLEIKNICIKSNILEFTVINDTGSECSVYLNDELIIKSCEEVITVNEDISKVYTGKFHIKVENENKFLIKSIDRDLSDYFNGLNKTLLGKDNVFFLVNDRNNEIRQHYDQNFKCNLDLELFRKSTISKRSFLEKMGINYALFVVPDKSITLRNQLPFKTAHPYRHTDSLNDVIYDLDCIITPEDRYKNDTHISSKSSLKIVSFMTSVIDDYSYEDIFNCLLEKTHFENEKHLGDLFNLRNWSYSRDKMFHDNKKTAVEVVKLNDKAKKVDLSHIPREFRYIKHRESQYYKNEHSISDKRAVILHDSTTLLLIDALVAYYKEVFFYWDHWFFNDELIEWFNPDDVLEIRTERFLDNPQYQMVNEDYVVKFPISAELKKFDISRKELNAQILIKDFRQLPVKARIKTYIDDNLICDEESEELYYKFNYKMSGYSNGKHCIHFDIKSKYKHREIFKEFLLEDSLEPLFKNLKLTYKGIGDTFFMVNDKSNELRQHYDRMYVSKFNKKGFVTSLKSKKSYLESRGVNYETFIIPDKSVVLRDYLPFSNESIYRHVDSLEEYLVDLMDLLDEEDYLLNDTNVSMCAGLKILSFILNSLHNSKSINEYREDILSKLTIKKGTHRGNLFTNRSWSYPENMELHDKYYDINTTILSAEDNVIEVDYTDMPLEFRKFSTISSQYYKNENSLSNLKALILCDDSIKPIIPSLISYYNEVFLYYDLWYFNKELVEWFNPDDIIEIRSERTLENAQYQLVSIKDSFVVPVTRKIDKFDVEEGLLKIRINYKDLRHMPVKSSCKVYVDKILIDQVKIDGLLDVNYEINRGEHVVEVVLEASGITKSNKFKQIVGE